MPAMVIPILRVLRDRTPRAQTAPSQDEAKLASSIPLPSEVMYRWESRMLPAQACLEFLPISLSIESVRQSSDELREKDHHRIPKRSASRGGTRYARFSLELRKSAERR